MLGEAKGTNICCFKIHGCPRREKNRGDVEGGTLSFINVLSEEFYYLLLEGDITQIRVGTPPPCPLVAIWIWLIKDKSTDTVKRHKFMRKLGISKKGGRGNLRLRKATIDKLEPDKLSPPPEKAQTKRAFIAWHHINFLLLSLSSRHLSEEVMRSVHPWFAAQGVHKAMIFSYAFFNACFLYFTIRIVLLSSKRIVVRFRKLLFVFFGMSSCLYDNIPILQTGKGFLFDFDPL